MTDIEVLTHRIADKMLEMEAANAAPYEAYGLDVNRGELGLLFKALVLLEAVRGAVKP